MDLKKLNIELTALLSELRRIYLFEADEEGIPKESISIIMQTWEEVNKILNATK